MGLDAYIRRVNRYLLLPLVAGIALVCVAPVIYLATGAWLKSLVFLLSGVTVILLAISLRSKTDESAMGWFASSLIFWILTVVAIFYGVSQWVSSLIS